MFINAYDNGSVYVVNNAFVSADIPMATDPDVKVIEIKDTQVFSIITENLLQNNLVKLPNNLTDYTPGDVIINVVDELVAAKMAASTKIRNFTAHRAGAAYMYDIFEFQLVSNILYAEGIFITDSNREKKYIDIINTNKTELIDALEKYLNIRDKISEYYSLHAQAKTALDFIEKSTTLEDVKKYLDNFISSFN